MLTEKEKEIIDKDFSYCYHSVDFEIPNKKLEVVSESKYITEKTDELNYIFRDRLTLSENDLGSFKNKFNDILAQINELVDQRKANETEKVKKRDDILSVEFSPLQTEKIQIEEEYFEVKRIFDKVSNAKNALQKRLNDINDAIKILTKSEKMIKVEIDLFENYGAKDAAIVEKIDHIIDDLESRVDTIRETAINEKQKKETKLDLVINTYAKTILEHKFPKRKDGTWWTNSIKYLERRENIFNHYKLERSIPDRFTNTIGENRKLKKILFDFEYYRMVGKPMKINNIPIYVSEGSYIGVTPILKPDIKNQMIKNSVKLDEDQFNILKKNLEYSMSGTSADSFKIDECRYPLDGLTSFGEFNNILLNAYFLTSKKKPKYFKEGTSFLLLLETPYSLWVLTPILVKE